MVIYENTKYTKYTKKMLVSYLKSYAEGSIHPILIHA